MESGAGSVAVSAARLAEHALDFRHGADQPVGDLQDVGGLVDRQAGQGGGHVEQVAFIQRGHEFAARPAAGQAMLASASAETSSVARGRRNAHISNGR